MEANRIFPKNEDCPLNKYEKEGLNKILDELEWKEYQRVRHLTSGYVESKVVDYDEYEINIDVTVGVDGEWSETNDFTIKRLEVLFV